MCEMCAGCCDSAAVLIVRTAKADHPHIGWPVSPVSHDRQILPDPVIVRVVDPADREHVRSEHRFQPTGMGPETGHVHKCVVCGDIVRVGPAETPDLCGLCALLAEVFPWTVSTTGSEGMVFKPITRDNG